jgi:opacity protein-like surface antigen
MGNKLLIGALLACVALPAWAADMPVYKAAAPAPLPTLSGSGLYLGINGGAAFTGQEYDFVTLPGVASDPTGTGKVYPAGIMAGGTIGFGGSIGGAYAAVESDFDYDFTRFETSCVAGRCGSKNSWFFAQKLVLGAPLPTLTGLVPKATNLTPPSQWPIPINLPTNFSVANLMPAVVAGIAEHNISACITGMACGDQWVAGALVGGQLRAAIAQNWTAKLEYDYVFFNKAFTPSNSVGLFNPQFKQFNEQRLMGGIDYHL